MLRVLFLCALALTLGWNQAAAFAADYPSRAIHMVVPWGAGGGTDVVARALAEAMKKHTSAPVVVENVEGAGGSAGNQQVATAAPDGYTILLNGDTDILSSITLMKTAYNLESFKYIGGVFYSPTWILSHTDRGINTFDEFLQKANAEPNKLILASTTPSGAQMVMAALLQAHTKAPFRIIPFQGGGEMSKGLLGNQVDAGIIHAPVMLPEVKAGIIKVIGVGGSLEDCTYEPLRTFPTLQETGIPVAMGIKRGVLVPAKTPDDVVAKLTEIIKKATEDEDFIAFGQNFGFLPHWTDGETFKKEFYQQMESFEEFKKLNL
jgi:tripartite-type tricarboxylate transporter receptor subunit TctC